MSQEEVLTQNLASVLRAMSSLPPYHKETVLLSRSEIALIVKGLTLLEAVRSASKAY